VRGTWQGHGESDPFIGNLINAEKLRFRYSALCIIDVDGMPEPLVMSVCR
jgi:hypothetical protein